MSRLICPHCNKEGHASKNTCRRIAAEQRVSDASLEIESLRSQLLALSINKTIYPGQDVKNEDSKYNNVDEIDDEDNEEDSDNDENKYDDEDQQNDVIRSDNMDTDLLILFKKAKTYKQKRMPILLQFARNKQPLFRDSKFPATATTFTNLCLIRGALQSGKALMIMLLILIGMGQEIVPIVILERIKDKKQLIERMKRLDKNLIRDFELFLFELSKKGIVFPDQNDFIKEFVNPIYIGDIRGEKSRAQLMSNFAEAIPTPVICLGNASQLKKVYDGFLLAEGRHPVDDRGVRIKCEYLWIGDEMDTLYKGLDTKFKPEFEKIRLRANKQFGLTATPFDVWLLEEQFRTSLLFTLPIPSAYKGPDKVAPIYIDKDCPNIRSIKLRERFALFGEDIYPFTSTILNTLDSIIQTGPWNPGFQVGMTDNDISSCIPMPRMGFINISRFTEHHDQIQDLLMNTRQAVTIVHNGNGLTMFSPLHLTNKITIGKYSSIFKGKKHNFPTVCDIQLSDIYSFLREQNSLLPVFTIGCENLSRGLSMVCKKYSWHQDFGILLNESTASDSLQDMRVCGIFHDLIPLTIYTTRKTHTNIYNLTMLIDKYCKNATRADELFTHWMPTCTVPTEIIPPGLISRWFGNKEKKTLITRESTDQSDDEKSEIRPKRTGNWGIADLISSLTRAIRTNNDTIVVRILQYFNSIEGPSCLSDDLETKVKNTGYTFVLGNYTQWAEAGSKYKILISDGGRSVKLNPDVINNKDIQLLLPYIYKIKSSS
jgi:hypothetical protein